MHVCQARDDELSRGIDDIGAGRVNALGRLDGRDSVSSDDNGHVMFRHSSDHVDDGNVIQHRRACRS